MSMFEVKTVSGVRLDVVASQVVLVAELSDGKAQLLLSTGIVYDLENTARSVRGYVRKALSAQSTVIVSE